MMARRYSHLGPKQLHDVVALANSDSTPVAPETKSKETVSVKFLN